MMQALAHQMFRMLVVAIALATAVPPASALEPGEMFDDPKLEERAREIGRRLRCVVCQNQSIFDSNANLAKDLRVLVRERIRAGDSDSQVVQHIAARYGDFVLMEPPMGSHTMVLWLAPAFFVTAGALLVVAYYRSARRAAAGETLTEDEQAAARKLLGSEEP